MIEYWTPKFVSEREPKRGSWFAPLWWAMGGVGLLIIGGLIFGFIFGTLAVGAAPAAVMVGLLIVSANALRKTRKRQARVLVAYLEQAVRLRLPIPEMLGAAAASETLRIANRLRRFRGELELGRSITDGLHAASPYVPVRTLDLIDAGTRNGSLPAVLHRLLAETDGDDRRGLWSDFGLFRSYLLTILIVGGVVLWAIDILVVPIYIRIFTGSHIRPPTTLRWLDHWGPLVGTVAAALASIVMLFLVGRSMRQLTSRALPRRYPFRAIRDRIRWYTPVLGSIERDRALSDAFASMADALDAAEPLDRAVQAAIFPHSNRVLHRQFESWSVALAHGQSVDEAARQAKLPALVAGLLGSASRAGDLPATLRFLARHYRSRFSRSIELLHAAAAPACALVGGGIVLLVWSALYGPMLQLLDAVRIGSRMW